MINLSNFLTSITKPKSLLQATGVGSVALIVHAAKRADSGKTCKWTFGAGFVLTTISFIILHKCNKREEKMQAKKQLHEEIMQKQKQEHEEKMLVKKQEHEKEKWEHKERMNKIRHPYSVQSIEEQGDYVTINNSPGFQPAHHSENGNEKPVSNLISDVIRKGGYSIVYAEKGVGKSILARQIAVSIATGNACKAFPDDTTHTPEKVIYLDAELEKADYNSRGWEDIPNLECFTTGDFNYPTIDDLKQELERLASETEGDCTIILDCISNPKFGVALSNPTKVKRFTTVLDSIRNNAKEQGKTVTFIVVNHASKNEVSKQKGCQDLSLNATSIIRMYKVLDSENESICVIEVENNRSGKERKWEVHKIASHEGGGVHFEYKDETDLMPSGNASLSRGPRTKEKRRKL